MISNLNDKVTPIVLTGGLGTRLRQVVGDRPKTMAEVAGKPFIEYILEQISLAGFNKVVLCVGYMSDAIQSHFGDNFAGLQIDYSVERALLGTGGAIRFALDKVKTENVLVLNGDSFCAQALNDFVDWHFENSNSASMLVTEVEDTKRYGRVNFAENLQISSFDEKGCVAGKGWINAGIYLLPVDAVKEIPVGRNQSLEKDFFPGLCELGKLKAYTTQGKAFIDIGTPESFAKANTLFLDWTNSLRPSLESHGAAQ